MHANTPGASEINLKDGGDSFISTARRTDLQAPSMQQQIPQNI
jgi:hypothetical protein